ncbi:MAG: hypothetical protein U0W65_10925 [Bacteroidia bacterium]
MENNLYKLPQDLLMDCFRILLNNEVQFKIQGIREKENILLVKIAWSENNAMHYKAKENLQELLTTYFEDMEGLLNEHNLFNE